MAKKLMETYGLTLVVLSAALQQKMCILAAVKNIMSSMGGGGRYEYDIYTKYFSGGVWGK